MCPWDNAPNLTTGKLSRHELDAKLTLHKQQRPGPAMQELGVEAVIGRVPASTIASCSSCVNT